MDFERFSRLKNPSKQLNFKNLSSSLPTGLARVRGSDSCDIHHLMLTLGFGLG